MTIGGQCAGRVIATLAGVVLAGTAAAQSPLVVNPQQGATPRPLSPAPSPTLPAEPAVPVAPVPTGPAGPRIDIPTPALRLGPSEPLAPPPVARAPGELPAPSGDPLAIDPANDPILRLARAQSPVAAFRAAIAAAVARNPAFDEAQANRTEAIAARAEVKARWTPTVDLSVSSFKVIDRAFSNDPGNLLERQRPDHRTDAILRIQQSLVDFGAARARVKAGSDRILVAAAGIEDISGQIALRAIAAWYNLYGYRILVRLGEAFAASQRDVRGQIEDRIRQGVAARGDLAQVDGYIASADSQLAEFRRAEAGAAAQFTAVMGVAPPADLGRAPVPDLSGVNEAGLADSTEALPSVRAARAAASAAHNDARAVWRDLLPTVSAGIDGGRYGVFETDRDYDIRGNVTLNWRLGGGGIQRRDQAFARAEAADARARRTREDAGRDAEIAWADVAALEEARAAIEQNYIASRRARDVLAERFRVSRGTLFDVIAAESNFFSVAARYIQTVTELDTARYVLLARTGRLLPALAIDPSAWDVPRKARLP